MRWASSPSRGLGPDSLVVELASNDGYLLRNFVEAGVPVLGIDPAPNQVRIANEAGVRSLCEFFGLELAERLVAGEHPGVAAAQADVIIANNVCAHVPDLNGFVAGMKRLLAPGGLITVENPYVRDLIDHCEFDTIYHEHLYYHSCSGWLGLAERHGLHLHHVEYFPDLHGGTLRWHLSHAGPDAPARSPSSRPTWPRSAGSVSTRFEYYAGFARRVEQLRTDLLALLRRLKAEGATSPPTAPRPRAPRCSTTWASTPTWSTSWSTATPTSRACTCPAPTSRSCRSRRWWSGGPTTR